MARVLVAWWSLAAEEEKEEEPSSGSLVLSIEKRVARSGVLKPFKGCRPLGSGVSVGEGWGERIWK
jgi:hypothetical protein